MERFINGVRDYFGNDLEGALDASLHAFRAGFPTFAAHGAMTLVILWVGVVIYSWFSPTREVKLIRENNTAGGIAYAGATTSMAIPLAFAMASSLNWADIVLWGVVTVFVQLIALQFVNWLLPDLPKRIKDGEIAAALALVSVKLCFAFILAAAVAGAPLARIG
ncbi:MAG: DUF350 domain-containing protein [Maricaulaceae bacterium]|jgi:putative membrane protein